jgi:hypothetical protein
MRGFEEDGPRYGVTGAVLILPPIFDKRSHCLYYALTGKKLLIRGKT